MRSLGATKSRSAGVFTHHPSVEKLLFIAVDCLALGAAYALGALWIAFTPGGEAPAVLLTQLFTLADARSWSYVSLGLLGLASFWYMGHYSRRRPLWDEIGDTLKVLAFLSLADATLLFLSQAHSSRLSFLATWLFALALVPGLRIALKRALIRAGKWQKRTVVVGAGDNACAAAEALHSEPLMGYDVSAFVAMPHETELKAGSMCAAGRTVPVVRLSQGASAQIAQIKALEPANVVVALDNGGIYKHQEFLKELHRHFNNVSIVPSLPRLPLLGMEVSHFFRHEALFLRLRNNLARRGSRMVKRVFDIVGASSLLLLLAPVFAYLVWQVRRDGGPAFYGHERIGQYGYPFKCYKFRSMVLNSCEVLEELLAKDPQARAEWARDFKLKNDPRITPIGQFLRSTSLDELPQLWNVLKGEMSLVGPRPIVEAELERYGNDVDYYLEAKPGMTGLWQISGRNDMDYAGRVNLDAWYVKNWSLWYDLVILFKTAGVVLNRSGAY